MKQDIGVFFSQLALALTIAVLVPGSGRGDDSSIHQGTGASSLEEETGWPIWASSPKPLSATNEPWKSLPRALQDPVQTRGQRDVTKRENMKALILKEIDEDMTLSFVPTSWGAIRN